MSPRDMTSGGQPTRTPTISALPDGLVFAVALQTLRGSAAEKGRDSWDPPQRYPFSRLLSVDSGPARGVGSAASALFDGVRAVHRDGRIVKRPPACGARMSPGARAGGFHSLICGVCH